MHARIASDRTRHDADHITLTVIDDAGNANELDSFSVFEGTWTHVQQLAARRLRSAGYEVTGSWSRDTAGGFVAPVSRV